MYPIFVFDIPNGISLHLFTQTCCAIVTVLSLHGETRKFWNRPLYMLMSRGFFSLCHIFLCHPTTLLLNQPCPWSAVHALRELSIKRFTSLSYTCWLYLSNIVLSSAIYNHNRLYNGRFPFTRNIQQNICYATRNLCRLNQAPNYDLSVEFGCRSNSVKHDYLPEL